MSANGPFDLTRVPAHLGLGATSVPQPEFTGDMAWYEGYGARHGEDGVEGRLVSMHTFLKPWDVWEMRLAHRGRRRAGDRGVHHERHRDRAPAALSDSTRNECPAATITNRGEP